MKIIKNSFVELSARERVKSILDQGTFREILGPFDRMESPHLPIQDIVPQSDDGVVIGKGFFDGEPAIVIANEGGFQGGGIGEVAGAKIAGALELVLRDNEKGIGTRPIVLLDTGGVRLQEANYGLLAISEIQSAIVALRNYVPVVGVISGKVGCFGGMSITAGLFSALIMTKEGRLGLNGPEVIEQEAGIEEYDSSDRGLIWATIGGEQRCNIGLADVLVKDDISDIIEAIKSVFDSKETIEIKSVQVEKYLTFIKSIDPSSKIDPLEIRERWKESCKKDDITSIKKNIKEDVIVNSRGRIWFKELTGIEEPKSDELESVLCLDAKLGNEKARFIAVVPDKNNRFPRVRNGEIGLQEAWTIAKYVHQAIKEDEGKTPRPIIAVVDVPSQAYGYKEELVGLHEACAAAVDAYVSARLKGHPIITLIVGNAISGAFLSHGLQGNKILAFDDPKVIVHAMSQKSAARITRRAVEELEDAANKVPGIAYDIHSFDKLGALDELLSGINADEPKEKDIEKVIEKLVDAVKVARNTQKDLSNRLISSKARTGRAASIKVREMLAKQWN